MHDQSTRGSQVSGREDLYRAIIYPYWWDSENRRPSSAAFRERKFSVDIASRTTPEATLARFSAGSGLVEFNCGEARQIGFDARQERDHLYPDNTAHAHVYSDHSNNERKQRARELAQICRPVVEPHLA